MIFKLKYNLKIKARAEIQPKGVELKRIAFMNKRDANFHPDVIVESDLSQDAKVLFLTLNALPSRVVPTTDELKKYCSIKNGTKLRRAWKELELRSAIVFIEKGVALCDEVKPAPEGEILPLKGADKIEPNSQDMQTFKIWYETEFYKREGERYPFHYGKDNSAIKRLLGFYGLEGAKLKAVAAWEYDGFNKEFFRSCARSLTTLTSIGSPCMS